MNDPGGPQPTVLLDLFVAFQLSAQALDLAFGEHDLDVPDFAIISTIEVEGPLTASVLARRLGMPQRTVLFRVRRLAADGLVERLRSDDDARALELRLTERGAELRVAARPVFSALIRRVERRLTSEPELVRGAVRDLRSALAEEVAALEASTSRTK